MEMKISEKGIKKFTTQEKLKVIKEVNLKGLKPTLAKYGLFPATYYYWKRKYLASGETGLKHLKNDMKSKLIEKLEKENMQLKALLGQKELEKDLKDKLLKKTILQSRRNN
jgi:putative transposase